MIDDMGWNDIGYQSTDLRAVTPNLNRMAAGGVRVSARVRVRRVHVVLWMLQVNRKRAFVYSPPFVLMFISDIYGSAHRAVYLNTPLSPTSVDRDAAFVTVVSFVSFCRLLPRVWGGETPTIVPVCVAG